MRKIRFFRWADAKKVEDEVNEFIKDKNVISIQYQVYSVYNKFNGNGVPLNVVIYDSVMVEYEEPGGAIGIPGEVWCDGEKLDFRG